MSKIIQQSKPRLLRLYFNLKVIHTILLTIQSHKEILKYFLPRDYFFELDQTARKFLQDKQISYHTWQDKISAKIVTMMDLGNINIAMQEAYHCYTNLFYQLCSVCDKNNAIAIKNELNLIDEELERIHISIELFHHIEKKDHIKFENRLQDFSKINFKDILINKKVENFFAADFGIIFRWKTRIHLINFWNKHLTKLLEGSPGLRKTTSCSLAQVVQLQNILRNKKSASLTNFMTHLPQHRTEILMQLYAFAQEASDPKVIFEKIKIECRTVSEALYAREESLKQYTWSQALVASSFRAPFNTYHYILSENIMRASEETRLGLGIKKPAIFNEPLSESWIYFYSVVLALSFVTIDYYASTRLIGLSYSTLQALTLTLLDDLTPLLSVCHYFNFDEVLLLKNFEHLKLLVNFCIYVAFHAVLFDATPENIGFFALSFCFATLCQKFAGTAVDATKYWNKINYFSQSMPRVFVFTKGIAKAFGFTAGNLLCYQYQAQIRTFFGSNNNNNTFLDDESFCLQNSNDRRNQALTDLGLPPEATFKQIKSHWHELAKHLHPDTLPATLSAAQKSAKQAEFKHLGRAYERLEILNKRKDSL